MLLGTDPTWIIRSQIVFLVNGDEIVCTKPKHATEIALKSVLCFCSPATYSERVKNLH